jgi:hypothetical protein
MTDDTQDLTSAEQERFARLERTMPIDPLREERTVRALRAEGLLGDGGGRSSGSATGATGATSASGGGATLSALDGRRRLRPLRVALAIAAGLGCFLAGRWSERAGVWGERSEAGALARGGAGTPHAVLADSQQHAPVIRF